MKGYDDDDDRSTMETAEDREENRREMEMMDRYFDTKYGSPGAHPGKGVDR